jgi:hypothetical protein
MAIKIIPYQEVSWTSDIILSQEKEVASVVLAALEGFHLDPEIAVIEGLAGAGWADPGELRRPLQADVDVILEIFAA